MNSYDVNNGFNPYANGYYNPAYPNYAQPQRNQRPQVTTYQYAYVKGLKGLEEFPVAPQSSMLFLDEDKNLCYMKSVDATNQTKVRYFRLDEIDENQAKEMFAPEPAPQNNYATKEEFDLLNKKFDELLKVLAPKQTKKENKDTPING